MRRSLLAILLILTWTGAATARGEPWLDVFAVDGADSLRVEVGDLLPEDDALGIEDPASAGAPEGSLTVIDGSGKGTVYPLVWDPLAGCLAARFPSNDPPFLIGAVIRADDRIVFVPESGLRPFPVDED